jgi:ABC-type spermidine/putrescine transport system permease subunit I
MNRRERSSGFGFVAPLVVLMVVAFNAPIAYMLGLAFWDKGRGFTLEHYQGLLEAPVYLRVLGNTMRIALIATVANVIIGYPLAHWIRGLQNRARLVAIALVVLPFWVSILVRTYAWIVVLGNGGLVNRALQWSGLTEQPVQFLYNELGVTIGMANVLLPFLVLPLFAAMIRIDDRLLQAAASLGAPPRTIFWKVYFPLTLPALAAGTLLVFILCLGFYITPAILGGGRVPMISNLLDTLINQIPRWEQASAISTILLVVSLLIFAAYRRLDRQASL